MSDEHIIEAIGRCRVIIRDGKVVSVEPPVIQTCPLAKRFAIPIDEITPESVARNIQNRIDSFGMFTPRRQIFSQVSFVGFGASELLSTALEAGIIDAAIIACDGAGTVITNIPDMVQGIGGRMSGLVKTSPIPEVIQNIRDAGGIVPDPEQATIDPVIGIRTAREAGYQRLAITVAGPEAAEIAREADPEIVIIVVHTTCLTDDDVERISRCADIVTSCASQTVRTICGAKALIQAGKAIPVFGMTQQGKEVIIERLRVIPDPLLVIGSPLPVKGDREPQPLIPFEC
ncbi:MAG: methanogenesis marker 8 protein [Methanobacteriota archaeon]